MKDTIADVIISGEKVGVVAWDTFKALSTFEYTPKFIQKGTELAPLHMPLRRRPYRFPRLHDSFSGLPGLLADCLPDAFGHTLIDDWLRSRGELPEDFNPVDRLCYIGNRGMGALEFKPSVRRETPKAKKVDISHLVELAAKALENKQGLNANLNEEGAMDDILRVGTSAGGARAKAVIVYNESTGDTRSGQTEAPEGYEHWIIKFDGMKATADGQRDPQGYGRIEYAYYLMAKAAGITMMPCRLLEQDGLAHFMTRRFDRPAGGGKRHYASLFGMAHMSHCHPRQQAHSYEDMFAVVKDLKLGPESRIEAFRRMAFNVLGCNKDDHTKNHGFILDEGNQWQLAPAFDLTYAYAPEPSKNTSIQQLSVLGKRENISYDDLLQFGVSQAVATKPKLKSTLEQVVDALSRWGEFSESASVSKARRDKIKKQINRQLME